MENEREHLRTDFRTRARGIMRDANYHSATPPHGYGTSRMHLPATDGLQVEMPLARLDMFASCIKCRINTTNQLYLYPLSSMSILTSEYIQTGVV